MMRESGCFFLLVLLGTARFNVAQIKQNQKFEIAAGPCVVQVLENCDDEAVKFYFYSSSRPGMYEQLNSTDPKVPGSYIPSAPIKIIIHGWGGSLTTNFTGTIRDAYLTSEKPHNVIIVDWTRLSSIFCYASSITNMRQVATCTSQILKVLAQKHPLWDPAYLHLIGHSLGAHVAAYTSNDLLAMAGRRAARITGLDPALPGFATLWLSSKLDASDADFVDVMHTSAGTYGKIEPSGHADFYMNGGDVQPFCTTPGRITGVCSHLISMYYFAESINHPYSFWGQPCVNRVIAVLVLAKSSTPEDAKWWFTSTTPLCPPPNTPNLPQWIEAYMGDGTDVRTRGTFYVQTAASYPFGLGRPSNSSQLFVVAPLLVQEFEFYVDK